MKYLGLFVLLLFGLACSALEVSVPTATPPLDLSPTLQASPTFLPIVPENSAEDFIGRSNPTAAALAAEAQPSDEPTLSALPTDAVIPYTLIMADGTLLQSQLYGAPLLPAVGVLLVHGEDGKHANLEALAGMLQAQGYHALVLSLRGHGRSGGLQDWSLADEDIAAALQSLDSLPSVTGLLVLGEGAGAVSGAGACGQVAACQGLVMLNPLVREDTPSLDSLVAAPGQRPVLLVAAELQPAAMQVAQILDARLASPHEYKVFPTLDNPVENGVGLAIVDWLLQQVPPNS